MGRGDADAPLLDLLGHLGDSRYRFITPTPETHRRVLARKAGSGAEDLRDVFGWNQPFSNDLLPTSLFERLARQALLVRQGDRWRSRIRVASIGDDLFVHSGFPTLEPDSVFFGPDTYRFVRFLEAELQDRPPFRRLVDLGTGTGAGAISVARILPGIRLRLTDINPLALHFAEINARHAKLDAELSKDDAIAAPNAPVDLVIANPPFMQDAGERTYRHGGGHLGSAVTVDWAMKAVRSVAPGGRILLYTGSAIVDGVDRLELTLRERVEGQGCTLRYGELDPDIFGEQLDEPGYEAVERIAAVGVVIDKF